MILSCVDDHLRADDNLRDTRKIDELPIGWIERRIGAQPLIVLVNLVLRHRPPQAADDEPFLTIYRV